MFDFQKIMLSLSTVWLRRPRAVGTRLRWCYWAVAPLRADSSSRLHCLTMASALSKLIFEMLVILHSAPGATPEVDRLREELTPKVKKMNDLMTLVKASYAESKKTLKGYYPQERWPDYGIPDKR